MSYLNYVSNTSWVDITTMFVPCPVDDIMKEIQSVENMFLDERDHEQYKKMQENGATGIGEHFDDQKKWEAVTLFSSTGNYRDILTQGILPNQDLETYMKSFRNLRNHKWTQLADLMPNTVRWINKEIGQYMQFSYIKIAKLGAGGDVPVHTDVPHEDFDFLNTQNTYNMLNSFLVELNYPDNVTAWHDGVELPYQKGSVIFCNQSKSHGTVNNGTETRYNLRIQGLHNKKFRTELMNKAHNFTTYPETSKTYL
jgi:hypothetical protein